ncbi:MAG: FAD-dependent oxidoreductase, partial [Planctomycetales bacterium]|nr:FAD-dependent oxidoreductase [Planctomycetales bacterium]
MSQSTGSVVIIGGGLIGAACADALTRRGWQVTLLDAGRFAGACSHANCGFVCPSHVLPLAEPGAVRQALAAMLKPNSPFSIKPRFDPALWSWLLRFARRCNHRDMLHTAHALHPLLESSHALYAEMMAESDFATACEWQTGGLLFVYQTAAALENYAATDRLLTNEFNLPARRMDGEELVEFEPALKPGLAGGWFYADDAHLRPDRLMNRWRSRLERQGVTIRENCRGVGFDRAGDDAKSIRVVAIDRTGNSCDEALSADAFVITTGASAPEWQRELGCKIPIQPGKGYSITMPRPERCPRTPMLLMEHRVGVTPMQSGYRLGSTMEFAGYDDSIQARRLGLLKSGAEHYLVEPYRDPVEETWFGWRPMTTDGLPLIGRTPRLKNVWLAAGHNMLGLTLAPATGQLVAELMAGEATHVDARPFRV